MGLNSTMVFISSDEDIVKVLAKYFEDLVSLYVKCDVNITGITNICEIKGYYSFKVEFKDTYSYEVVGKLMDEDKLNIAEDVYITYLDNSRDDLCLLEGINAEVINYISLGYFISRTIRDLPKYNDVPFKEIFDTTKAW